MVAAGYKPSVAAGTIAAGGTIGVLVPPSILAIVYGVFSDTPVTQVFLGSISIGLLTAIFYCMTILAISWLRPDIIPSAGAAAETVEGSRRASVLKVLLIAVLIVFIFFGMFSGLFTATEAGAVGALGTIVISLAVRRLTCDVLVQSLPQTMITSTSLFIVGVGATMFTRFLGISGVSGLIASFFANADLGYYHLMTAIVLVYLALGTFMEPFWRHADHPADIPASPEGRRHKLRMVRRSGGEDARNRDDNTTAGPQRVRHQEYGRPIRKFG